MQKLNSIYRSYRAMPGWVQLWVLLLVLVNAGCVGLLDHAVGQATAWAALFVVVTNVPIMLWYGGMNRAMAIPHLFAWIPLSVFLLQQLSAAAVVAQGARYYAIGVLLINGISLAFDLVDTKRWLSGERETPGID